MSTRTIRQRACELAAAVGFEKAAAADAVVMTAVMQADDEYVEKLAEIFHRAFRKHQDLAPPWPGISDANKAGVIDGVKAILDVLLPDQLNLHLDTKNTKSVKTKRGQ